MEKEIKCLFIDTDDMAKHNSKLSKKGKYYPKETGVRFKGRFWCWNCKLYFLRKDFNLEQECCKECEQKQ